MWSTSTDYYFSCGDLLKAETVFSKSAEGVKRDGSVKVTPIRFIQMVQHVFTKHRTFSAKEKSRKTAVGFQHNPPQHRLTGILLVSLLFCLFL